MIVIEFNSRSSAALATLLVGLLLASCQSAPSRTPPSASATGGSIDPAVAEATLRAAVDAMDAHGLYANGSQWEAARGEAVAGDPPITQDDLTTRVKSALKIAGGQHSSYLPADEDKINPTNATNDTKPAVATVGDDVTALTLTAFHSTDNQAESEYISAAWQAYSSSVPTHCGLVIDARDDTGGNLWPMLAAVAPALDIDKPLLFDHRDGSVERVSIHDDGLYLDDQLVQSFPEKLSKIQFEKTPRRIILLQGPTTASSGEAVLVSFRGQGNVESLGQPSFGFASTNTPFAMPDGSSLNLTTAFLADRDDNQYSDAVSPNKYDGAFEGQLMADAVNELHGGCQSTGH